MIPKINLLENVFQGQMVGDDVLVGQQEILKLNLPNLDLYYAHNAADKFGNLYRLKQGDQVVIQDNGQVVQYRVSAKQYLSSSTQLDQLSSPAATVALTTCSVTQPDKRIVIYLTPWSGQN